MQHAPGIPRRLSSRTPGLAALPGVAAVKAAALCLVDDTDHSSSVVDHVDNDNRTTISTSPTSSPSHSEKRYAKLNISLFRSADGEERALPISRTVSSASTAPVEEDEQLPQEEEEEEEDHQQQDNRQDKHEDEHEHEHDEQPTALEFKPRISSVTDASTNSPDRTTPSNLDHLSFPEAPLPSATPEEEDDTRSTYSHASAINLDDLDDDDLAGLRASGLHNPFHGPTPATLNRQVIEYNRRSFANSFAKARQARISRQLVLAPKEIQPQNNADSLAERCVSAFSEVVDINREYARASTDRFYAFAPLFTKDERMVIGEFLKESATRLKPETDTPWRSPIPWQKRTMIRAAAPLHPPTKDLAAVISAPWKKRNTRALTNDTLVRSVVFGTHVIPGALSAESLLLRMAGEYHREEVNRKASRAERIDIPISFAMTLTALLATFTRLECNVSYKRYRSRSAANRRSSPQAYVMVKTKYDGVRLSFGVTLHGESPCTVLFKRPRIFSQRKIDEYATLVTEAKDILLEFGHEVAGPKD